MRWLALLITFAMAAPAQAYTIGTGFSDACHEKMTITAYLRFLGTSPTFEAPSPHGRAAQKLSLFFAREFPDLATLDAAHQNLAMNMVIGVHEPDTRGQSFLDLEAIRNIHAAPDDQYSHALRTPTDDGPAGDATAIAGTRARIHDRVDKFRAALARQPEDEFITTTFHLDFYGLIDVDAWAPAFYLGQALHAIEDSFSHTIRSDDFHRIRHVMNFADAISLRYQEDRDGLRHSTSMDLCVNDTGPIVDAAIAASTQFLLIAVNDPDNLDTFLDAWFTHEDGCVRDNAYCASPWVAVARRSQTYPYLGCMANDVGAAWPLLPIAIWRLRRRFKKA